jgi:radical SAM superfamily enzyme YgiQ (UPF0313 family)
MRAPGDIVLVSCYEPGYQPIALASPAAFLREAGYAPLTVDLAVEELAERGLERLARARLVAISAPMHTALSIGLRLAARVRALNPRAHLCFFGLYAALNEALLRRPAAGGDKQTEKQKQIEREPGEGDGARPLADSVLGVECEQDLVTLAAALESPGGDPLRRRSIVPTPLRSGRPHRPAFLVPDRSDLPALDRYARLLVGDERRVAGHVEATRGCKYLCRHCPIPPVYQGRFFAVPVDIVLEDARNQIAAGARHITFGDPDFLNSAKHALAVARGLHAAHPQLDVSFSFTAKVEHIVAHRALFPELAMLGCVFIVSAVESLSDTILALLDKGHTRADVVEAFAITRAAGISLRPTFVAFTPFTTIDDYLELCRFIRERDLEQEVDPIQLAIRLLIPPGSLLLERAELAPFLIGLDDQGLTHRWRHPDPRMDQLEEAVAALVEDSAHEDGGGRAGLSATTTFARIHALAARFAGQTAPPVTIKRRRAAPPRLSEAWFCCAQPTKIQIGKAQDPDL